MRGEVGSGALGATRCGEHSVRRCIRWLQFSARFLSLPGDNTTPKSPWEPCSHPPGDSHASEKYPIPMTFVARAWKAVIASATLLGCLWGSPGGAAEPRVTFANSVGEMPPAVATTKRALAAAAQADSMEFGVALKLRNYEQMQARIARGETIARGELERVYLPLQSDYDAVVAWLVGQGFTITQHDPSRLVVYARGTTTQVQEALQVHLVTVTANGGATYHAADTAPSLPLSIATPVLGINHLQPYHQRQKRAVRLPMTNNAPPYTIRELMTAYNGASLGVTGAGQKIAILIDTVANASDLTAFWTNNSVTRTGTIENINVNGGTLPAASGEETLDIQWSGGVAPGATIRVYASRTLSDADLDKCLQRLINDLPTQTQIHQLSISLGLGETYVTAAQFTTDAQLFATIASSGVSIFVSSGDGGSTPDDQGGSTGPLQVEHYASDPSVTAVGGTSLNVSTTTGLRTSESAWSGSGGGVSIQFARPTWQTGTGVPAGTTRVLPDVCLAADPNTGAYVYLNGTVQQYGGTSWSAPAWAGFCALVNEARANAGKPALGLINPSLYPLIGTTNFVDVTTGTNATSTSGGKYAAAAGYDLATGVGAPHMQNLLNTLVAQLPPAPTIASFTPTGGVENTTVVITGTNFTSVGAVTFNGTAANFTVNSATQITVQSPAGATTGPLRVVTPSGTAVSATNFTVVAGPPAPSITSFSPAYGLPGTSVAITGANLTGATAVKFNGVSATSFTVNPNGTQITAAVPATAASGVVSVTTPSGTASSSGSFTVLSGDGTPTVAAFSPTAGVAGATVVITGTNFVNVTAVTFGGAAASSFTVDSATQITTTVPSAAVTGPVAVIAGLGTGASSTDFTVGASPAGNVVISQIYGGGGNSGATYLNDYVELYNRSGAAVTVSGWSVQYASSTGSTWTAFPLSGTIQPGRYYLLKLGSGGSVGAALPTADATSGVNISATRGKVALVNSSTAITSGTGNPVGLSSLVDFVGFGSADAYEGTGPTSAPSVTTAVLRANGGATDTGDNSADFATGAPNPRNSATGATTPDLTIAKTHTGNFTQGDVGKTYSITITNGGTAATSGTVTVTDALPAGLTATALSGTGWTTNLATLTATRSDALAVGASYPALTVTVSVAANAAGSLTNVASVSGGGETNTANNSASDVTTILTSGGGGGGGNAVPIVSWDMNGVFGYGASPYAASSASNANLTVGGLTRGSGVTQSGTAASNAWGGTGFNYATPALAIAANAFATFTITPKAGYTASFSAISQFDYRRSSTGPTTGLIQYQIGSAAFVDVATVNYTSTASSGGSVGSIDLSTFPGLQNVAAGTVVTFRIVNYGASAATGPWYIFDKGASTSPDFIVSGTVTQAGAPDLTISATHGATFIQGDHGRTYSALVTNSGTAPTTGVVTVTETIPTGLSLTAMSGSGWTVNLTDKTATRSDALAAGSTYPPLTVTVDIASNAPSSVTNVFTVAGGGETNTTNNTASDATTILVPTPSQSWRQQWYGDSGNSGSAADLAVSGNDGLCNLLKYALNLVPPQSPASTKSVITTDQATGALRMTITKNPAASDLIYSVEGTSDLSNSASWSGLGIIIDQDTSTTLQAHDTTPMNSGPRYLRLKVVRP